VTFNDFVETTTRQYAAKIRRSEEEAEREKMEAFAREWKMVYDEVLAHLSLTEYPEVKVWADADDLCGSPDERGVDLNMQLGDLGFVRLNVIFNYGITDVEFETEVLSKNEREIVTAKIDSVEELIARMRITQLWREKVAA
jgi:hypothetical protein